MLIHARVNFHPDTPCVKPSAQLPLPAAFDFAAPVSCAKRILAIMCQAAGESTLTDCKLVVNVGQDIATITAAGGLHVHYSTASPAAPRTSAQIQAYLAQLKHYELGTVKIDPAIGWDMAWWYGAPVVDWIDLEETAVHVHGI